MSRSTTMAGPVTDRIITTIRTDMYRHYGPRMAFCAAMSSGSVQALAHHLDDAYVRLRRHGEMFRQRPN